MSPDPLPEHLVYTTTERGFDRMPPIPSVHGGRRVGAVEVYESSAAFEPYLWLNAEITDQFCDQSETTIHLRCEDAVKLAEQILFLARNHYQNPEVPQ